MKNNYLKPILVVLLLSVCTTVIYAKKFRVGDLYYRTEYKYSNEVCVYKAKNVETIVIPSTVTYKNEEYKVVGIEEKAFKKHEKLKNITIPNSIKGIREDAFYGCSNLSAVYISDLSAWCKIYFWDYKANPLCYAKNLYLNGEKVTDLVIPNDVTEIKYSAFRDCTGLTSVTIPNSVTSIGGSAFHGCTSLTSVTIPNSVTTIGRSAFSGCDGLTSIEIPGSVTAIGNYAFEDCTGLTSVTIPNSVTSIGRSAFRGCTGLTSITIPNSVTSIGDYAFKGCRGLTSVTIGDGVTSIGSSAFYGCSKLNCVQVGDNVKEIGDYAFSRCSNLSVMTKLDSVANISEKERILRKRMILHDYFFNNCRIPVNVEYIGSNAFYQCSKLENVIIPSATKRIGLDAFGDCDGLASIDVALNNPVYDSRDNCNAIIKTSTNEFIVECKNTTIPDDIRKEREIAKAKKQAELMAAAEAKRKKQQAIAQAMFGLVGIAADAYVNSQNHNHVHSQQSYSNNYGNYSSSYSGITSPPVLDANKVVADFNAYQQAELQKKFIAINTYRKNAGLSEYSWQEFLAINAEEEAKAYQMRAQWQNAPNRNETSSSNAGEAATRVSSSGSGNSHSSSHSTSCPSLRIGNGEWYCVNTGKCGMCGGDGLVDGLFGLKPNSLVCTLCEGTGKCKYCR